MDLQYCQQMEEATLKHCKDTLKRNNYEPLKKLGMGGFGVVFLVQNMGHPSELYSVKCTNKKQFTKKPAMRRYLKQEISIMENLHNPYIVQLYRTFEDDGWIFMVMEYCDMGNLSMIQTAKPDKVFSFEESVEILTDVIDGLLYMHMKNVLHRDIKPQNILRKREKHRVITKICDLGFSREAKDEANTFCGTTFYMAPEIFEKKQYDHRVDIWALGVLFYAMLFGTVPFKGVNMMHEIIMKCKNGFDLSKRKLRFNSSIDSEIMQNLKELFGSIFVLEPSQRMSLEDLRVAIGGCTVPLRKKITSKKTIDTDGSDEDLGFPNKISFQMEEVLFVRSVLDSIKKQNFLQKDELKVIKYFLDKVCLSILSHERMIEGQRQKDILLQIWSTHRQEGQYLHKKIKNIEIPKLADVFTGKPTINFREYKEEYRLAVGHAFYKTHKSIKDQDRKMRLKLKIFCCHVINRVFDKDYRQQIFKHYYSWVQEGGMGSSFTMQLFQSWVEEEKVEHIVNTVELINNKFYKKSCK